MPSSSTNSNAQPLSLSRNDQWILHHVLLHRIEQETTGEESDPPPIAVFQAFDTLERGEMQFTVVQLNAIQSVLVDYHHSTSWWDGEQARLEQLLLHVTDALDDRSATQAL